MTKTQIFLQNFCHGQICCPKTLESRKKPAENKQTAKAVCYLSRYLYSTVYAICQGTRILPFTIDVKAKLDGYYVQHMSFWMDVKCFFGTIASVIRSEGVVEGGTGTIHAKEKQDGKK